MLVDEKPFLFVGSSRGDLLGFPKHEAENLKVRSALMAFIREIIAEEGITQARLE